MHSAHGYIQGVLEFINVLKTLYRDLKLCLEVKERFRGKRTCLEIESAPKWVKDIFRALMQILKRRLIIRSSLESSESVERFKELFKSCIRSSTQG